MPETTQSNIYWTQETENAVIRYNACSCSIELNRIYEQELEYPINKMVENIFNTFKFSYFDDTIENVKKDAVSHCVKNLHLFDESKGKSFGYFSTAIKNYLMVRNNKRFRDLKKFIEIANTNDVDTDGEDRNAKHLPFIRDRFQLDTDPTELLEQIRGWWEVNINQVLKSPISLQCGLLLLEFLDYDFVDDGTYGHTRNTINKNQILELLSEKMQLSREKVTTVLTRTRYRMKAYNDILSRTYKETGVATCDLEKVTNKTVFVVRRRTICIDNEGIKTEHKYLEPTAEPRKLTEGAKAEIRSRYYHNNSSIVQLSNEFGLRPSEVMTIATSEGFIFKKTLERSCPKCGEILTYQTECEYRRANTENSVCRNCSCAGKTRKDLIGENNPNAVLDFEDVRLIRGRFSSGSKYDELAEEFGVSELTIRRVANRMTYKEETVQ